MLWAAAFVLWGRALTWKDIHRSSIQLFLSPVYDAEWKHCGLVGLQWRVSLQLYTQTHSLTFIQIKKGLDLADLHTEKMYYKCVWQKHGYCKDISSKNRDQIKSDLLLILLWSTEISPRMFTETCLMLKFSLIFSPFLFCIWITWYLLLFIYL